MSKTKNDNYDLQREEISIMSSIYMSELEYTRQTPPYKVTIQCKPFLEHWVTEDLESFTIAVELELPKGYPQEAPKFELLPQRTGLPKNQISAMAQLFNDIIKTYLGTPMIFELIESLRV